MSNPGEFSSRAPMLTRAPSVARRYVKLWGWEPLPHGTEQLLHNILQTLCASLHSELRTCIPAAYARPV